HAATTSRQAIWHHHHHTNLVQIASSLRADMIFGKNRRRRQPRPGSRPAIRGGEPSCACVPFNWPLFDAALDNHLVLDTPDSATRSRKLRATSGRITNPSYNRCHRPEEA